LPALDDAAGNESSCNKQCDKRNDGGSEHGGAGRFVSGHGQSHPGRAERDCENKRHQLTALSVCPKGFSLIDFRMKGVFFNLAPVLGFIFRECDDAIRKGRVEFLVDPKNFRRRERTMGEGE